MITPDSEESSNRDQVLASVRAFIREQRVIAMNSTEFQGKVGEYSYFFEGEDDLLHVGVSRNDEGRLDVEEAQAVLSFLVPGLAAGVVWVKPGVNSHHFYFAHDELL